MLHRVVSQLLVPTLLLQGLSFAHSHGSPGVHEPPGHDQNPHVHWHFFGAPAHHHHDDADHLHPDDADDDHDEDGTLDPQTPATGHDNDAVYVAVPVSMGWVCQDSRVASGGFSTL